MDGVVWCGVMRWNEKGARERRGEGEEDVGVGVVLRRGAKLGDTCV